MGGGAEVLVRGGRLIVRVLTPVPALFRGLPLHPDDQGDPYVFRLDPSMFGMPTVRVVFARDGEHGVAAAHLDLLGQPLTLYKRPAAGGTRAGRAFALAALAAVTGVAAARRRRRAGREVPS